MNGLNGMNGYIYIYTHDNVSIFSVGCFFSTRHLTECCFYIHPKHCLIFVLSTAGHWQQAAVPHMAARSHSPTGKTQSYIKPIYANECFAISEPIFTFKCIFKPTNLILYTYDIIYK